MEPVGNQVIATVRGSAEYLVVLTLPDASCGTRLRGECGCPYGQEGFFCKHCVAVGLAILRDAARVPRQRRKSASAARPEAGPLPAGPAARSGASRPTDLTAWLHSLSADELVALVCDQVVEDDDWRRRLELRAATAASDIAVIGTRALGLLRGDQEYGQYKFAGQFGYLEGPESWYYARRVRQVTEAVRRLTETGQPGDAMVIAQQALTAVTESSRHASDRAGVIAAAAAELAAAHQAACRATAADPLRLADFLAERMINPDDAEQVVPSEYADLLGQDGMLRLRERIAAAWTANRGGQSERLAMENMLTLAGDVDGLVAVLAANLDPRGIGHLRITDELDHAGRTEEALAWAERGLRESSEPDGGLADYVVERYCATGRLGDALAVRRDRFQAAPSVSGYELLHDVAEIAGEWPPTRQWALDLLRGEATRPRPASAPTRATGPVLIDVLIADGDIDAAWQAAQGIASDDQLRRLADLVLETRPSDALTVYRRLIGMLLQQAGDAVDERIAHLLAAARACHGHLGTGAAFEVYLRALRDDHKRRRRLIRLLDARGLR